MKRIAKANEIEQKNPWKNGHENRLTMVQFDYISRGFTATLWRQRNPLCRIRHNWKWNWRYGFRNQSKMEAVQPDVNRCIERYAEFFSKPERKNHSLFVRWKDSIWRLGRAWPKLFTETSGKMETTMLQKNSIILSNYNQIDFRGIKWDVILFG